jgi:MFS transporter, DHA2 family, metal-tetracycline-proton antiporter
LQVKGYRKLLAIGFCVLMVNLGNLFLMPLVLSQLFHKSAMSIGLLIAPGAILTVFMTRFVGRWIDRYGNVRLLLIGHVTLVIVLAIYSWEAVVSPVVILCGYLFFSPALSATLSSLNNETSHRLSANKIGAGMGLMQLIQFFGGSISVAVCGLLLEAQSAIPLTQAFRHVYELLLAICLCSILLLLSYRRSARAVA